MKHRPTFKPSPAKRPVVQRLTPLAWAVIGVVALVVVLAVAAAVMAFGGRPSDEPWWTPTPTYTPTPTPSPTEGPTPTPTAWYEGMVTPTPALGEAEGRRPEPAEGPEPTPAYPAWWSDQMTQDEEGRWWPPDEVIEMVREDFQAWYDELYALVAANDVEGVIEGLPRWYTGDSLEWYQAYYTEVEAGEETLGLMVWEDTLIQVQNFSEDGLECTLGWTALNGTTHEWVDGEFVQTTTYPGGLYLWRMRYDPTDGRWKMIRLIKHYPAEGGGG